MNYTQIWIFAVGNEMERKKDDDLYPNLDLHYRERMERKKDDELYPDLDLHCMERDEKEEG